MKKIINFLFGIEPRVLTIREVDNVKIWKDIDKLHLKYTPKEAASNHELVNSEIAVIIARHTKVSTVY